MSLKPEGIFRERLFILDFYFSNAPMLHNTKMKFDVRSRFRELTIPRPEKSFLTYPSPRLLFHQMEPVQKDAVSALLGKGLAQHMDDDTRVLTLSTEGRSLYDSELQKHIGEFERNLATFLIEDFGPATENGMKELRESTGLRRAS
ncbi:hypothetical protein LO749_21610 (plasmid) [Paracoccus denitrificans]|uniref:ABC-three component system middle component 5 n=1 Tax=Paracoccus denitrificans TaxID=266 RepID=UPI001E61778B|nr:ABC-three component system middle component 5 [Paracoccus denitrificans]UFS68238.1 hypothetical protein LO749_21610 [Paracoccus denitrificans]